MKDIDYELEKIDILLDEYSERILDIYYRELPYNFRNELATLIVLFYEDEEFIKFVDAYYELYDCKRDFLKQRKG